MCKEEKECIIYLDHNYRELLHHGTTEFPCAIYGTSFSNHNGDDIPWHWHEEMEIIFIEKGTLEIEIPSNTFTISQGDGIFINSGILHHAIAAPLCTIHSILFHSDLVCGSKKSTFFINYINPIIQHNELEAIPFRYSNNRTFLDTDFSHSNLLKIREAFKNAYIMLECKRVPGYEFQVRENISNICFILYETFKEKLVNSHACQSIDTLRVTKMLDFIHENFTRKITLSEIALSANISTRECLRCFKRTIKITPIQYLLKYRLNYSVTLLLENNIFTISDIAFHCGFDSSSNFTKHFRLHFNTTPSSFRKNHSKHRL